ncbi:hypothetical protein BH11PAT2_BH11PAT2_03210 [soil metagenome]
MKIIDREIPKDILYEDDDTIAFLDIAPTAPGHTLVISKKPCVNVFDTDEATWSTVMRTVLKMAPAVRDAVGAKGVQINSNHGAEAGQAVMHLHIHIIPRHDRSEFEFWPPQQYKDGQEKEIADKIRSQLS